MQKFFVKNLQNKIFVNIQAWVIFEEFLSTFNVYSNWYKNLHSKTPNCIAFPVLSIYFLFLALVERLNIGYNYNMGIPCENE